MTTHRTNGLSPKAVLAFFYPAIGSVVSAVSSWIVTGNFNDSEIRVAVAGLGASGLALLGAYVGKPGDIDLPDDPEILALPLDKPMRDHLDLPDGHPDAV